MERLDAARHELENLSGGGADPATREHEFEFPFPISVRGRNFTRVLVKHMVDKECVSHAFDNPRADDPIRSDDAFWSKKIGPVVLTSNFEDNEEKLDDEFWSIMNVGDISSTAVVIS